LLQLGRISSFRGLSDQAQRRPGSQQRLHLVGFEALEADGYRYVRRDGVPLLGLGPLELFVELGNPQLLTRCAVWYGADARAEWYRRGGK
jgi:hypothetical protein